MLNILSKFWNNENGHTGYCLTEYSKWMVATSGETGLHNNRVVFPRAAAVAEALLRTRLSGI